MCSHVLRSNNYRISVEHVQNSNRERKEPDPLNPDYIQREIEVFTIDNDDEVFIITELGVASILAVYNTMKKDVFREYDVELLVHLVAPIVDAINFIHSMGYIHGDIKMSTCC